MRRRDFLAAAPMVVLPARDKIRLAEGGRSSYSISLPAGAIPSESRAASELQRFIEEMSGARLPITAEAAGNAILLRHTEEYGPEGFALRTDGPRLVIAGGRPRGVMYGACALLEKFGCRWFTPEVSRIPKWSVLETGPLDEVQKPAFEYREPYFTEACDKDWAARNRMNGNLSLLDDSAGGKVQYFPFVHTFDALVPPGRYFAEHPEYYSLLSGIRTGTNAQLCLANPDVLRIATATVFRWIDEHPEATIFSVSQNDNERFCECDGCRRIEAEEGGMHSGPILRFVNAIAAEVEKKHPGKLIDTLAYQYSEDPPANVRPRPNVRIRLCPIGACQAHPYEKCEQNGSVMRNLQAWSRITNQLYVWHYITNFANYLLPFPDFDELAADIPMYRRHGVVGLFLEGAYPKGGGAEAAELRSYVSARLLWDTNADPEAAIGEFLAGVYGVRAAKPMRAWFDLLHKQVRFPPRGDGQHIWTYTSPRLSDRVLAEGQALFRKAEAEAADDGARTRVRKARLPLDYAAFLKAKTFHLRGTVYSPAALPALKDRFAGLLADVRSHGITSIHEGRNLDQDEREFAANIKPCEAVLIGNRSVRAAIVPSLGGRVLSFRRLEGGLEMLRVPEPDERSYPDAGGAWLAVYGDSLGGGRIPVSWKTISAGATSAVLLGSTDAGIALHRTFRLDGARLVAETRIENAGSRPRDVAVLVRTEIQSRNATLRFGKPDGGAFAKQLLPPGERPAGQETYAPADIREGEWQVESLGQRFPAPETDRCHVSWRGRGQDFVTLSVWSKQRRVEPGGGFRFDTEWILRDRA